MAVIATCLFIQSCGLDGNPFDEQSSNYIPDSTLRIHAGQDSIKLIIETEYYDTITVLDTVTILDTTTVFDSVTVIDTLIFSDTLIFIDTTYAGRDTIQIKDSIYVYDTTKITDTLRINDTTVLTDTLRITDTLTIIDTLQITDTTVLIDTVVTVDTVVVKDTVTIIKSSVAVSSLGAAWPSGSGYYENGVSVTINAGTPPSGQQFNLWTTTSNGVIFADANSSTTTFIMPDNPVFVTANFIKTITYGTFNDSRDNNRTYRTIEINGRTWMAENLNYPTDNSSCYTMDDEEEFQECEKYGRLYNWDEAKDACPIGWHLPDEAEWNDLIIFAGNTSAGTKLKSKSPDWDGTNDYGFSALPGGQGNNSQKFQDLGSTGTWWMSESSGIFGQIVMMNTTQTSINTGYGNKAMLFSVRCIKEDE
jgi:uncharacterized protein (TIGR02145 family)